MKLYHNQECISDVDVFTEGITQSVDHCHKKLEDRIQTDRRVTVSETAVERSLIIGSV